MQESKLFGARKDGAGPTWEVSIRAVAAAEAAAYCFCGGRSAHVSRGLAHAQIGVTVEEARPRLHCRAAGSILRR